MNKKMHNIMETFNNTLKGLCDAMSYEVRLVLIISLLLVFAIINLYIIFNAVYHFGQDNHKDTGIEIEHLRQLDLQNSEWEMIDQTLNLNTKEKDLLKSMK